MSVPKLGLTGGIGSGKSTVARMFAEIGIPTLDLDQLGHALVCPGSNGLRMLMKTFGKRFLQLDGSLNRAALAQHCFADAGETAKLNAIMHPLIRQAEDQWLAEQSDTAAYAVIEASVLLESGGAGRMDAVLVVLANEALRCKRVLTRGDRNAQQFNAIVARQCSDVERRKAADLVIVNNHDYDALRLSVQQSHDALLRHFQKQ